MKDSHSYLMESLEEVVRLEIKTDPETVRKQARWCGLKPGFQVLDAGCGPGKVTSILYEIIRPGGRILGTDYSRERIEYAKQNYGQGTDMDFVVHDLRHSLKGMGPFDLIWARFVLEYNLLESREIVKNLTECLKPGGRLCLLDLDHNCLNHYELPNKMDKLLRELTVKVEQAFNFDPYAGRKLYSYLYDMGYEEIQLDLTAHHLIYGSVKDADVFNWIKKIEVMSTKAPKNFEGYPGGHKAFFADFIRFFNSPRRFTYTPLILCKGTKPVSTSTV